jgi:hypothetical protein
MMWLIHVELWGGICAFYTQRVAVNDEVGSMWKEAVVAYFKVLPSIYLEKLEECEKYANMAGMWTGIGTWDVQSKYHSTAKFGRTL